MIHSRRSNWSAMADPWGVPAAAKKLARSRQGRELGRQSIVSHGEGVVASLLINGQTRELAVPDDMPLLWVLRDVVGLTGTKFSCGIAQCGACTVHVDGRPLRSCVLPVANLEGKSITTIEAVGATPSGRKIQEAWLDIDVVQCGYCQSGQIMSASALLARTPNPTDSDIDAAMSGNICRCGTY